MLGLKKLNKIKRFIILIVFSLLAILLNCGSLFDLEGPSDRDWYIDWELRNEIDSSIITDNPQYEIWVYDYYPFIISDTSISNGELKAKLTSKAEDISNSTINIMLWYGNQIVFNQKMNGNNMEFRPGKLIIGLSNNSIQVEALSKKTIYIRVPQKNTTLLMGL